MSSLQASFFNFFGEKRKGQGREREEKPVRNLLRIDSSSDLIGLDVMLVKYIQNTSGRCVGLHTTTSNLKDKTELRKP